MAMQNCWSPANCAWMVDRLLTVSCVAAYVVPKFTREFLYDVMELLLLSMAAMP